MDKGDKHVYFGSDDGRLYKIDAGTGKQVWAFAMGGNATSSPALSTDGRHVFVGASDGNLLKVDTATGRQAWTFATGGVV